MEPNTIVIQIPAKGAKYVNVGIVLNDDIAVFELNFFTNAHNWGVVLINPDGESVVKTVRLGTDIFGIESTYEDAVYTFDVCHNQATDMYEVIFH